MKLFCWTCSGGNPDNKIKTSQVVLEKEKRPNGRVLIRATCTICKTVNIFLKGEKDESH